MLPEEAVVANSSVVPRGRWNYNSTGTWAEFLVSCSWREHIMSCGLWNASVLPLERGRKKETKWTWRRGWEVRRDGGGGQIRCGDVVPWSKTLLSLYQPHIVGVLHRNGYMQKTWLNMILLGLWNWRQGSGLDLGLCCCWIWGCCIHWQRGKCDVKFTVGLYWIVRSFIHNVYILIQI